MRDRFLGAVVTSPVAHFVAGLADWITMLTRFGWARARGRRLGD